MSRISNRARRCVLGLVLSALSAGVLAVVSATEVGAPQHRTALVSSQAEKAVLLGAAVTGNGRLVAVGERGLVLLSDDDGATWRQVAVPVSVTLTAVRFAGGLDGVAVGHGGVVLTSGDGGEHWTLRLEGRRAAELALESARASADAALFESAGLLVEEGPDKPFLDVALGESGRILAVGAYGLAFVSEDFGQSWTSWMARLDNPMGMHFYAVRQRGDTLLLAGERGLVLHSADGGASFTRLEVPYQGSLFTAELPRDGEIVLAGLKGNLLRSVDGGQSWQQLDGAAAASFTASTLGADGVLYLVNQAGQVLGLQRDALVQLKPRSHCSQRHTAGQRRKASYCSATSAWPP